SRYRTDQTYQEGRSWTEEIGGSTGLRFGQCGIRTGRVNRVIASFEARFPKEPPCKLAISRLPARTAPPELSSSLQAKSSIWAYGGLVMSLRTWVLVGAAALRLIAGPSSPACVS